MNSRFEYRMGLFFVLASAVTWSTAGFFTRLINLSYPTMIAGRGLFGALGLIVVIIAMKKRRWLDEFRGMGRVDYLYVAIVVVGMIAFVTSLGLTSVAHNAVIFATIPFISALLGWLFLREIPSASAIVASAVAISGVALMAGFGLDGGLSGDLLSLAATLCMASSIVLIRKHPTVSVTACACIGSATSGLVCLPFADLGAASAWQIAGLAAFGLLNSAAGLTLFSLGSRYLPAVETALLSTLDTPLAPFWVWIAFGEAAGGKTLIGGAMVLCAVIGQVIVSQRQIARMAARQTP